MTMMMTIIIIIKLLTVDVQQLMVSYRTSMHKYTNTMVSHKYTNKQQQRR
jgi:hypothetical protein